MAPNDKRPALTSRDIRFGIELEFVHAFHETLLRAQMDQKNDLRKIVKDVTSVANRLRFTPQLEDSNIPRPRYSSWGLQRQQIFATEIAPYTDEPMSILETELKVTNLIPTKVFGFIRQDLKTADLYNERHWIITNDPTVVGVGTSMMSSFLDKYLHAWQQVDADSKNWDSYGVEVISPIMHSTDDSCFEALDQIVLAIKGRENGLCGSFPTKHCALQVHVECTDTATLAQLARILYIYEDEISRLHPQRRRPTPGNQHSKANFDSNRISWTAVLKEDNTHANESSRLATDCSTRALKESMYSNESEKDAKRKFTRIINGILLSQTPVQISCVMNAPSSTKKGLRQNGERERIVNFVSAARERQKYASTVEFRQHAGTLEADEIKHWVRFVIQLVKLAEYYTQHPNEFPITFWEEEAINSVWHRNNISIMNLLWDLGLDAESRDYWEAKIAKYMVTDDGIEPDIKASPATSNIPDVPGAPNPGCQQDKGATSISKAPQATGQKRPGSPTIPPEAPPSKMTKNDASISSSRSPLDPRLISNMSRLFQALTPSGKSSPVVFPNLDVNSILNGLNEATRKKALEIGSTTKRGETFSVEQNNAIAPEHMTYGAIYFYPTNFNKDDWVEEYTSATAQSRMSMCGANALYKSFRNQFPSLRITLSDVINALDNARRQQARFSFVDGDYQDSEMTAAVKSLSNGTVQIVAVDRNPLMAPEVAHHPTEREAYRITNVDMKNYAHNLYIGVQNESTDGTGLVVTRGHWTSMRRLLSDEDLELF
ncbi:hypothetical protein BP6252_02247 [Coleophoma cylindrospora]|uniref:Uncharacterized protein n=1 Tax=Coleophoma cylindrospora TaxID=1849047 RepID=A0A3D8SE82_9HELO|nr:hypothetical protein BP6252_02247 [Coleophoma cylindrospora]